MNFRPLDMGSGGNEVRVLQETLKNLGYRVPQVTGRFDSATKSAVRAFQNDNGLTMSGIVDERTWNLINKMAPSIDNNINDDKPGVEQEDIARSRGELTDWDRLMGSDVNDNEVQNQHSSIPEIPQAPTMTEASEIPQAPAMTEVPEIPQAPVMAEVPEIPQAPPMAELPDTPQAPPMAEMPETSQAPPMAELPETPQVPQMARVSKMPSSAGLANQMISSNNAERDDMGSERVPTISAKDEKEQMTHVNSIYHDKKHTDGGSIPTMMRPSNETKRPVPIHRNGPMNIQPSLPRKYSTYPIPDRRYYNRTVQPEPERHLNDMPPEPNVPPEYTRPALPADARLTQKENRPMTPPQDIPEQQPDGRPKWTGELRTIQWGSRNRIVNLLQRRLTEMGYYSGTINGYFGFETRMAVIDFQSDKSLKTDGIVNDETWHALYQVMPVDKAWPELKKDNAGQDAMTLQKHLNALGYYNGKIDGIFGSVTSVAVETFQKDKGMTVSGVVDDKTWQAMKEAPRTAEKIPLADSWVDLKAGSNGKAVNLLQDRLKQVGFFPSTLTASFDSETERAVEAYELENGLTVDGIVTYDDWERLVRQTDYPA